MADASPESIPRLIENSEKGLAQIEMSSPILLEGRKAIEDAINKQEERNAVLYLLLLVYDTLLAENEVIYDLSASLDPLLKATDDYAKRYYMQSLNLCFWEACQLFVGEEGDEDGLLSKLVKLTKELNQAGCELILKHIIDDIQEFRTNFADRDLRNITRHYDDPVKMYEKQRELTNIEFFAKGTNQLMAIRMEVSVVSSYLLNLLVPVKNSNNSVSLPPQKRFDLKGMINDAMFKAFKEKNLTEVVQQTLSGSKKALDDCYRLYRNCGEAAEFLEDRNCEIPETFKEMEMLIKMRMETLYLRCDHACSVWGYLNASSDKERSQNLRLIHITKQAALTHLYGYNEKARERSLWAKVSRKAETNSERLNTADLEKTLNELTSNLGKDRDNSNMFAHYRYKQEFYIPARLEAFSKMVHYKELTESVKLLNVCKSLETYTYNLLYCISETQRKERKKRYDEWMEKIEELVTKTGNDERVKTALKPMTDLIEKVYGGEKSSRNA